METTTIKQVIERSADGVSDKPLAEFSKYLTPAGLTAVRQILGYNVTTLKTKSIDEVADLESRTNGYLKEVLYRALETNNHMVAKQMAGHAYIVVHLFMPMLKQRIASEAMGA